MIKTRIDLSKIPAKELPRETIAVDLGEGENDYWIHALNDADWMCISGLYDNPDDIFRQKNLFVILLACGLEALAGDQRAAKTLLERKTLEAQKIGNRIFQMTIDFYNAKGEEAKEAEKN